MTKTSCINPYLDKNYRIRNELPSNIIWHWLSLSFNNLQLLDSNVSHTVENICIPITIETCKLLKVKCDEQASMPKFLNNSYCFRANDKDYQTWIVILERCLCFLLLSFPLQTSLYWARNTKNIHIPREPSPATVLQGTWII